MKFCVGCVHSPRASDFLNQALRSHPGLEYVLDNAEEYRVQVALGLVEERPDGTKYLKQYTYRAGAEYFYPASSVKLFAAVAASQKLAELRNETSLAIGLDTPLTYYPLFSDDVLEAEDPDNVDGGTITVRQQIREIFLVSDNSAFNYLYELVGQEELASSLARAGLVAPRIVHRLSEFRTPDEHRQLPRIDFAGDDFHYSLPERSTQPLPPTEPVNKSSVGDGFYVDDELRHGAMDFSGRNYIPLVDLQRGLCKLVAPEVDCGGPAFELDEESRAVMIEAMSQFPRESENPRYDASEYPDNYVKKLLPGVARVVPKDRVRIYNKSGRAYGFSTENAWVTDTLSGCGFFLAATLYTNSDGLLNDDEYEYESIANPFVANLGEAVARSLWSPCRAPAP